jgi:hypothetical protein
MTKFLSIEPTLEDYWRSLVLFGQNVACYKFALAKALIELIPSGKTTISLEELALPYSQQIIEHLKLVDKQIQSKSSTFLGGCRQFNRGLISQEELITLTTQKGFNNVLDAFHNLSGGSIPISFFDKEQWKVNKKITLTDELFYLNCSEQLIILREEAESRWRLVETAWQLNISKNLIAINYDPIGELLFTHSNRRVSITSCRYALNGYQRSKCFYCFRPISLETDDDNFTEVDHFIPHTLGKFIVRIQVI